MDIQLNDLLAAAQQRAEQAEAEMMRLQALLDRERCVMPGRYMFYHRHRALSYIRSISPELYQEACNAATAEIDRDGGKSFDDVVAALEAERDAALAVAADSARMCKELRRLALAVCDGEIAYKRSMSVVSRAALNALRKVVE